MPTWAGSRRSMPTPGSSTEPGTQPGHLYGTRRVGFEPHEPIEAAGAGQSLEFVLASVVQLETGAFEEAYSRS
jgi:hypothetical protein